MANQLPDIVSKLCYGHDAWIVGGAVYQDDPKDWDVVVPYSEWNEAAMLIPPNATANSFGGFEFKMNGILFDVWPDEIGKLMTNKKVIALRHPQSGKEFWIHEKHPDNR